MNRAFYGLWNSTTAWRLHFSYRQVGQGTQFKIYFPASGHFKEETLGSNIKNPIPGISGRELSSSFRLNRPELPTLYMSGYSDDLITKGDLEMDNTAFIAKPFSMEQLLEVLSTLLS